MGTRSFKASLLIKGLSGIIAQVILMRELLVSFHGNELTLGIILANWLILVAIGSFIIGKTVEKVESKIEVFALFQLFFAVALPMAIYLSRSIQKHPSLHSWRGSWLRANLLFLLPDPPPRNTSPGCPFHLRV